MLQDGGLFANGATASYYNPALLADLERQTGSQLHFTRSHQDLLPDLRLGDLYQRFQGLAMVLPDSAAGADLGVGFFQNYVSFGRSEQIDLQGNVVNTYRPDETVWGAAIGVRLGLPVSVGGAAKYYESRLAQGVSSGGERLDGTARNWAFDLGVLANPRLSPAASLGLPWFQVTPSFAASLRNLGPDAFYFDVAQADPIPMTLAYGLGIQAEALDLAGIQAAVTEEKEVHRRLGWGGEPVRRYGYSASILCFQVSEGWLDDDPGKRDEYHSGRALELDMLRMFRLGRRLITRDFRSPPAALEKGFPFSRIQVLGIPFRANPRLILGRREIELRDSGIRDGQKANFIAFSL